MKFKARDNGVGINSGGGWESPVL